MLALGIDIGGTGIKGAPVDLDTGELTAERHRIDTPHPATPSAVAEVVSQVVDHFSWTDSVGCTFPAVIKSGIALTASNVDPSWIGTDIATLFEARTASRFVVLNDADAAGLAEMAHGAGRERSGVVMMVTLGTGIGSALFVDGHLVPNTELGHLELDGAIAETVASSKVRSEEELSWKKWSKRVNAYLQEIDRLLWPDLIIIGGGVSKKADKFLPHIETRTEVVAAALHNNAGIVGAAMATLSTPSSTTALP